MWIKLLFSLSTSNSSFSSLPPSLGSNLCQVPSVCALWFDLQLEPSLCCTAAPTQLLSHNFLLVNCFIEQLIDKRNLREKSSKGISCLFCVGMCVLGTKPFSIFMGVRGTGRSVSAATAPKMMFSREKHQCTTTKIYICSSILEQVLFVQIIRSASILLQIPREKICLSEER